MQIGQSLGHPRDNINNKVATNVHPNPGVWGGEQLHQSRFGPILACFLRNLTPLQCTRASQLGSIYLGTSFTITKRHRSPKGAIPGAYSSICMLSRGQIRAESAILPPSNDQQHGEKAWQASNSARSYPYIEVLGPSNSCHTMKGQMSP